MTKNENIKSCFVICPIGHLDSPERKRSDEILKFIISPACEKFNYTTLRADKISDPGFITTQIIDYVLESDLVIADLTDCNPNVFYELGVRHSIGKPFILMIDADQKIPFDVSNLRVVHFKHDNLTSAYNAKNEIIEFIKQINAPNFKVQSPVSESVYLRKLQSSPNPVDHDIASIISSINDIKTEMISMKKLLIRNSFDNNENNYYFHKDNLKDYFFADEQKLESLSNYIKKIKLEKFDNSKKIKINDLP